MFYWHLSELVHLHCGEIALRMASKKDDEFARRLASGEPREQIAEDAEPFFDKLLGLGRDKPDHFSDDDWQQLKLIRDQWV
jgi:hypothetical protein